MDDNLGMAYLRTTRLETAGGVVWVVTSDGADFINIRNVRNHGELGQGPRMAVAGWLCELASGNALAPVGRLEMMKIAVGDRKIIVIVLQLSLTVIVEQPVKQLLVVWSSI